jgi:hypothetical protein
MVGLVPVTAKHGPDVIVLEPDAETRARILAMGRNPDSFRLHGDRKEPPLGLASDGCGILPHPDRMLMWSSSDKDLLAIP